jgi:hypothetical protein
MDMLPGMSGDTTKSAAGQSSLWTTPAASSPEPLREAAIDRTVSVAKLREAAEAARQRAAAFMGNVSESLLRKSF